MIYVAVEGHGELGAMDNLLARLATHTGLSLLFKEAKRYPKLQIEEGISKVINVAEVTDGVTGVLIIRDEDDRCPKESIPQIMDIVRRNHVRLPVAFVLLYREYETLFIPCLNYFLNKEVTMGTGKKVVLITERQEHEIDPESKRDAKGYISRHFKEDNYKQTIHQLPLTRLINFEVLDESDLACYGTLKRALSFLADHEKRVNIYPNT